jgi:signal transduction histidine kinase
LVVGADGVLEVRRTVLREALASLEALAVKVERSLENAALAERLLRAEKLAGLGLLAGGMAHALNNPLTAVLGFAELIAGTTGEQRVREDAGIIVQEALRMRQSVESLLEFWRPVETQKRIVDLGELVREVAAGCVEELEERGVRLEVDGQTEPLLIAGNRHRLRQLLEHLLNNAAQAVGREKIAGQMQTIWLAVNGGGETVQMTVSDTGRGFQEPSRIFDPFGGEVGTGMGLSVCYGIAHEHGGEIRATNLMPHGAMVTVELPAARAVLEPKVIAETAALA